MKSAIERVHFSCPKCLLPLESNTAGMFCSSCEMDYPITASGKLLFSTLEAESISDTLDRIKNRLKRFQKIYNFLIRFMSPVYPTQDLKNFLKSRNLDSEIVINLGSGSSDIHASVVNFDLFEYESVDVLSSIDSLPLADNSVDAILNVAVLEHVPNPIRVVKEFHCVLKPGGQAFCFVPFIQGFHASSWDFQRYTSSGLRELFKEFEILKLKPVGPTSGLLWIFQEWFAIPFSFGSKRLHLSLWLIATLLTWPFKYFDFFLRNNQMSENIASGFVIIAAKN